MIAALLIVTVLALSGCSPTRPVIHVVNDRTGEPVAICVEEPHKPMQCVVSTKFNGVMP